LFTHLTNDLGIKVYLFCQVTGPTSQEDDRIAVQNVLKRMQAKNNQVITINQALCPSLLKACYGQMELFLASRLHSGIFAMGMGAPTLFINYLTKTRGVLEAAGVGDWVLDLSGLTEASLIELVEHAWSERERFSARLKQLLPGVITQTSRAMDWIANEYEAYRESSSSAVD
jgi:colanic acid/amylovoran biosynthesis protein